MGLRAFDICAESPQIIASGDAADAAPNQLLRAAARTTPTA
jgi:hypothetical protein